MAPPGVLPMGFHCGFNIGKGLVYRVVFAVAVLPEQVDDLVGAPPQGHQAQKQAVLRRRLHDRVQQKRDKTQGTQRHVPDRIEGELELEQ